VQVRAIDDLDKRIRDMHNELESLVIDYNMKKAINDNLGLSISAAHSNLAMFDRKFTEQNEKMLLEYKKKMEEVVEADKQLQQLIKENREKEMVLARERGLFDSERETNRRLVADSQSALAQNNAQWKNREVDILAREENLAKEKAEFETYKESLQPEIAKITSIKNENAIFLQRIEQQRMDMENLRLSALREKESMVEKEAVLQASLREERERIKNEDARLRNWEQNLKDYDLEIRAKLEEANRVLRREKLEKTVGASKEK